MKLSTSALFLFIVSSSVTVVKSEVSGDGLQNFLNMVNTTVTTIVDTFQVVAGCEADAEAVIAANPALVDAWNAWEDSYAYTTSSAGSVDAGGKTMDMITGSYNADALASYESACTAVGDGVAWVEVPPTDYSCITDGYDFMLTESNFGACYPTTEACAEYGQGSAAIVSYVVEQMLAAGVTCTVAPAATDGSSTDVKSNGDSSTTTSTNGSTSSAAAAAAAASSMIASFSVATIAAATVGTVMYL
jgi:hypothetical protein